MVGVRASWRAVGAVALACAASSTFAVAVRAQAPAAAPARIFGVELERADDVDRLLVLASGELDAQLEEVSAEELILRIRDATLDPRAARQVVSGSSGVIRDVAIQARAGPPPVVEIHARRVAGLRTELSHRGAILALEVARPPEPARPPDRSAATVRLELRDKPIVDLVREVQRVSQRRFVWDDRLQGTVTVIVQDAVTVGEALEILYSTLQSRGFAAVPGPGDTLLVLPIDEARARAPRERRALDKRRARLITVLTRFRTANAEQLVNLLAPFAGTSLSVSAYPPTNGAILVGPENGIHRWLELAQALDETSRRELAVIHPRHRTAGELRPLLAETLVDPLTGRARAELLLDERANALILRAEPATLKRLREQIAQLDATPEDGGDVLVIRPRFVELETLAAQIEALGSARGQPSTGAKRPSAITVARHPSTRSLLVTADAPLRRELRELVDALDVEPPLIAIEANVLEVSTTGTLALGVDAFLPSTDPSNPGRTIFGVGLGDPFDTVPDPVDPTFLARYARDPVLLPVIGPGGTPIGAIPLPRDVVQLKAAEGIARVRSLMRPHIVTLAGEEHEFSSGLNVPVPSASTQSAQGSTGDPLATRVTIERQDVGLRLRVKPLVGEEGDVRIAVDLEVTAVQPSAAGARSGIGPELARRALQAHTRVSDGGVAVLAMVIERAGARGESGPPELKDLPVLGNLLRQSLDRDRQRTLIVTLQARVLRSADERLADTIRLRTAQERSLARAGSLRADGGAWALLVATRTTRSDAEALAGSLGQVAGRRAQVAAWRWGEAERFDVVLSGFRDVRAAATALPELEAKGWFATLVPVPAGAAAD